MRKVKLWAAVAGLGLALGTGSVSLGQNQPGGDTGGRGGRGNFDPAQMRDRMNQMIKERLGCTDEEWTALQPRFEKVQTAQRNASSRGGFSMFGGFGSRGPGGDSGRSGGGDSSRGGDSGRPSEPETPLSRAASELRKATENKDADPNDVKAKLAAYREAKAKAKEELAAAQKELVEVLTPRQEAVLVSMGMLD